MARFDYVARIRLYSGVVLYIYVVTHLLNHALGLVSLAAMEAGRIPFLAVWRSLPGTALLTASLVAHAVLALYTLYERRTLRMPGPEAEQVISGLVLPPLLAAHVIGNRGLHEAFALNDTYAWVLLNICVVDPVEGVKQAVALVVAWIHGTLGIRRYLMLRPWFGRCREILFASALLVPTLALLGFVQGGREAAARMADTAWFADQRAAINWPGAEALAWYGTVLQASLAAMAVALLTVFAARALRTVRQRRMGLVTLAYPGGRRILVPRGTSVLEASRINGIPHASVCGGRGRCSTCRVRVETGPVALPEASEDEQRVLHRVGAPDDVRLACQLRPEGDVTVTPLLPSTATTREAFSRARYLAGEEREIAVLFADLRSFTRFCEGRLPFDVVFILNQYFHVMGRAIEDAGGRVDKYIGDGIMALFGVEDGPEAGCRNALAAAAGMARALRGLNEHLGHDFEEPLRMGLGIHTGAAIVGEMGYGDIKSLTAMGDAVNTASRLETATKEFGCRLVASCAVADRAGIDLGRYPRRDIEVRGRSEPVAVFLIDDGVESLDGRA
jgi:adenylate cyclase